MASAPTVTLVHLPGGDPTRTEARFNVEALAALQGALAAAQQGTLSPDQAREAIDTLQAYVAVRDTGELRRGVPAGEIAAEHHADAADGEPTLSDIRAALSIGLSRHQAATAIRLIHAASLRLPIRHSDAADPEPSPGCHCDAAGVCTHTDSGDPAPQRKKNHMTTSRDRADAKRDYETAMARHAGEAADDLRHARAIVEAQARRSTAPIPGALTKLDASDPAPSGLPAWQRPLRLTKSADGFDPFGPLRGGQRAQRDAAKMCACGDHFEGPGDRCPVCADGPRAA